MTFVAGNGRLLKTMPGPRPDTPCNDRSGAVSIHSLDGKRTTAMCRRKAPQYRGKHQFSDERSFQPHHPRKPALYIAPPSPIRYLVNLLLEVGIVSRTALGFHQSFRDWILLGEAVV